MGDEPSLSDSEGNLADDIQVDEVTARSDPLASSVAFAAPRRGETLSNLVNDAGAIDIVAVRQSNGLMQSTPFHVRFRQKSRAQKCLAVRVIVNGILQAGIEMESRKNGDVVFVRRESSDELKNGMFNPTSRELNLMNLRNGINEITFSIDCEGESDLNATIYLWPRNSKIVVSDIDGTITKSDAMGQILPLAGRDWTHDGVVALFTKIHQHGYKIVYLSSRPIGQAKQTKKISS